MRSMVEGECRIDLGRSRPSTTLRAPTGEESQSLERLIGRPACLLHGLHAKMQSDPAKSLIIG